MRTGSDNGRSVANILDSSLGFDPGGEITDVTIDIQDGCITGDVYRRMPVNLPDHILKMRMNVHALQGIVEIARHSTQLRLLLHQVNFESLACQTQRAGHSGDAAANHQTGFVDR